MKNTNKTTTYTEGLVVLATLVGFVYSAASLHFNADSPDTEPTAQRGRRPASLGVASETRPIEGRRPISLGLEIDLGCLDGEGPAPWVTVQTPEVRFKGRLCRSITNKKNKPNQELPLSEYEAFNEETSYTALFYKEDKPRCASTEFIPLEQGLNHLVVQPSKESKVLTTPEASVSMHTIVVLRTR